MADQLGLIAVIISGFSALVSALSAFWALRATRLSTEMLKSKIGKLPPGPDVEEGVAEQGDAEEVDK
ncbi:hypothetical protein [uncultured Enterovirga sp.]|uniref:hypothetical protein n=1 Tax=uncultured Enterovirga sp. TaxID=2026352 RepID=UPI0035CC4E93